MPETVEELRARVDAALAGSHLHAARLDDDAWAFMRGESKGLAFLANHDESAEDGVFTVRVPVMRAPKDGAGEFARRLLEINLSLAGLVAFALDEEGVAHVVGARFVAGLDPDHFAAVAAVAAGAADRFRDELLDRFGRENALEDHSGAGA